MINLNMKQHKAKNIIDKCISIISTTKSDRIKGKQMARISKLNNRFFN